MITSKQKDFLNKIKALYGKNPLPSYEKICKDIGFRSKNSVWQYFQKLLDAGFIQERDNRFFISHDFLGVPYFECGVRAGFPSPAEDYMENRLSFDEILVKHPVSTISIRVIGDSMVDAGIFEDDIIVVEKGREPVLGDIVVAIVDGEFTVKYYKMKNGQIFLEPANNNYPNIIPSNEMMIFGVVTGLVRTIKKS
ncbi:MAG: translesion error-prone DNA polymerase V autoproteolytic subunit [bacterium]